MYNPHIFVCLVDVRCDLPDVVVWVQELVQGLAAQSKDSKWLILVSGMLSAGRH